MKVIIAGSRTIEDFATVEAAFCRAWEQWGRPDVTEIVSGGATGADELGESVAFYHRVPVKRIPARWMEHGDCQCRDKRTGVCRAAGPRRNRQMAEYADALVAVSQGQSRGTANMIAEMRRLGKPVYVHEVKP